MSCAKRRTAASRALDVTAKALEALPLVKNAQTGAAGILSLAPSQHCSFIDIDSAHFMCKVQTHRKLRYYQV